LFWVFLAGAIWLPPKALAQPIGVEQQQKAAEFVQLYEHWRQTQDPEEKIALGEQALALEPVLKEWPWQSPRERVRGELWFNLGQAYADRIRGAWPENLEKAIAAYQAALTVFTREALPREWATTQNNLAIAYVDRIRGDRADNLEKAIAAHDAALTVRTREALPRDWATTQSNLATAYWSRIRGDRADNLEKAIGAYQAALTVFTREALPRDWAQTQSNLATAFTERIRGNQADNLENAIGAHEAALTVFTREALPRDWATTQSNLGLAYAASIRGDRGGANIEKAINAHEAALTVFTREASPRDWAQTQNNLANAYGDRIRGVRADNIEKAIGAYEAALTVFTREILPHDWAQTHHNLATAYRDRVRGDRADNIERAIASYEAALTVRTRETLPRDHLLTSRLLGSALLEAQKWREAGSAYASSREAFLLLFGQGLNDAEARDLIAQAGPLFAEAAFSAIQLGNYETALSLASEGRARLMAVFLKLQTLDLSAKDRQRLDELRVAIRTEQRAVDATQGIDRNAAVEKLVGLRQELLWLVKNAAAAESGSGLVLAQARAAVTSSSAIVVPILTKVGGKIIIVFSATTPSAKSPSARRPQSPLLTVLDLPELTTDRINVLLRGDGRTGGWLAAYNINSLPETERNRRWPEWLTSPPRWRSLAAACSCLPFFSTRWSYGIWLGSRSYHYSWSRSALARSFAG
jgi:hypothetical protein